MTEAVRHALLGLQPPVLFQKWLCRMRRLISAGADTLILGILVLSAVLSIRTAMSVYPLNSYWIELLCDYSGGFVRRFLLGEILNNLPGIAPETAGIAVLAACYAFVTFRCIQKPEGSGSRSVSEYWCCCLRSAPLSTLWFQQPLNIFFSGTY